MSVYEYSSAYSPAAPVIKVKLGAPGTTPAFELLDAFIDTGADATLIPTAILRQIQAKKVDHAFMRSQWGERRAVSLYAVALDINQHHFDAMWVVGDEFSEQIVLG